jgi:hypothetical protein
VVADRGAEIAVHEAGEEPPVLRRQRPVQAERGAQRGLVGGLRGLAEHDFHRVARDQVDEEEHQGRDREGDEEEEDEPARQERLMARRPRRIVAAGVPEIARRPGS